MKFETVEQMLTTARVFGHCFDPAGQPPGMCHGIKGMVHKCVRCDRYMCMACENIQQLSRSITRSHCSG